MVAARHILMTVQYERDPGHAQSLMWVAPELSNARMTMIEDHIAESSPSRTWEGTLDGPTFERFARAWHLPTAALASTPYAPNRRLVPPAQRYTFDGMNWEERGEAPIVWVTLEVTPLLAAADGS